MSSPNEPGRRRAAAKSVLLVVLAWGEEPASLRTILPGQSLWLGDRPGDLPLPADSGSGRRNRLVDFSRAEPIVSIPGATEPPHQVTLAVDESCSFAVAASRVTVSRIELCPTLRRRRHPSLLPGRYLAGAAFASFGLLALMALSLPMLGLAEATAIERALAIDVRPFLTGTAEPVPPDPPFQLTASRTPYLVAVRGEMRCGDAEMGKPEARTAGRYAVQGPKDNPDPHFAAHRGRTPVAGPPDAALERSAGGDSRAPTAIWAREDALGNDETSARGAMWGDPIQTAPGADGLGLRRVEGGWAKRFDWSPLGGDSTRVVHAGLRVSGPLRGSLAARALATRFDRFRGCYQRSSQQAIRVELEFTVTSSGSLADLAVQGSTDPAFVSCLGRSLDGLTLGAKASSPSRVTYPLFFQNASHSSAPLPRHDRKLAASCCGRR